MGIRNWEIWLFDDVSEIYIFNIEPKLKTFSKHKKNLMGIGRLPAITAYLLHYITLFSPIEWKTYAGLNHNNKFQYDSWNVFCLRIGHSCWKEQNRHSRRHLATSALQTILPEQALNYFLMATHYVWIVCIMG